MIVAKYKFDKSIYENFIPVFNDGYTGYSISDEIDSENSNHIIRTIECDTLPTKMRFGDSNGTSFKPQRDSLLELIYLNTINIVDMIDMFAQCSNLISVNTEGWNTSNVTSMYAMFYDCKNLTSLDVSNFNTSKVVTMYAMFFNCSKLTSLDVSNWDTSKVTTMASMFNGCNNLTSLDVSNWNTSNVTYMNYMFDGCKSLTSLDVSNWDTSNVTNMRAIFVDCKTITSLDVSNWDTSKVTDINGFTTRCDNLIELNINNISFESYNYSIGSNPNLMSNNINMIKIYLNSLESLLYVSERLIDRTEIEPGYIVTTIKDQIDEETMNALTAKNWQIKDLVAQYRYDANTYENLLPEFNTEFSSDKYEIHDSVSEIVIDNILCERGALTDSLGTNATYNEEVHSKTYRTKNYIPVIGNTTYHFSGWCHLYWYDANKKMIGEKIYFAGEASHLAPANAKYLRFYRGSGGTTDYSGPFILNDMTITAKLITRSIESVNGDLPTLMRFGYNGSDTENHEYNGQGMSLLKIYDMNTSELTTGYRMFKYCKRVESIKANWDTSNMIDMFAMFTYCQSLTSLDLSNWNTSNVTDMRAMFSNCQSLTSLDVSNFDTRNVTSMGYMFINCNNLTSLDLSNFDTTNVTNMGNMFTNCSNLTSLDVSNFNTSKATYMSHMFSNCQSLTSLDVSNFDTSNVTTMQSMFIGCISLTSLDVSNWDTINVTDMGSMFHACNNLTQLDVSNWKTSNVTNMESMFNDCNKLTTLDVSNFDTKNVDNMQSMFYDCKNLTSLNVSNFNTSEVTDMNNMFYNCNKLTSLDVSNFNTSNVTTMNGMFQNCNKLTSLDVSNFNTSNVTTMNGMFQNCNKLTSIDVSNWNTSSVTKMWSMFNGCTNLTSLDVSNFDTSKVTNMSSMFWKCISIKTLILSNWNMSEGVSMSNIFGTNGTIVMSLETLDMPNSEITTLANTSNLFYNDNESLASIKNIRCNNVNTINNVILPNIPTRSSDNKGQIITSAELSQEIIDALASKNWTVVSSNTLTKVAEYVYDSNTWNSMIPEFNNEFIDYFIDDIEDENGLVTRTISSMGGLPTSMIFGVKYPNPIGLKERSLYNVNYIDTSNLISANEMFRYCVNLMSINTANWDTSKITNMNNMFYNCTNLTSLDLSNFNTSNVADMNYMFINCSNLTSLDLSIFNTSKVTYMSYMFSGCTNLTSLDLSNFNTSKVGYMKYMFKDCTNLTSLDLSNFNTSNVIDMSSIFLNAPLLKDIGMLYCTPSTINTIASNLPTTHTQTIWIKDTKPNECTVVNGVEFKEYKENSVMINLNSPLLKGDRIEVKDGKLCHYHKMRSVVLDGSEEWKASSLNSQLYNTSRFFFNPTPLCYKANYVTSESKIKSDMFITKEPKFTNRVDIDIECITVGAKESSNGNNIRIGISKSKLSTQDINGFKQWLSENPITVVYELAEPYYEDITPLQSDIVLETYLESNLDIYTKLPIKTNLTYLTNIANTSSIEEDINAINEGTDLTNLLEDEINN